MKDKAEGTNKQSTIGTKIKLINNIGMTQTKDKSQLRIIWAHNL